MTHFCYQTIIAIFYFYWMKAIKDEFPYTLNFAPIIDKITKELNAWKDLPLLLFGRAYLYKMLSFPKLLYPLQTILLLLRSNDVKRLNKTLILF